MSIQVPLDQNVVYYSHKLVNEVLGSQKKRNSSSVEAYVITRGTWMVCWVGQEMGAWCNNHLSATT